MVGMSPQLSWLLRQNPVVRSGSPPTRGQCKRGPYRAGRRTASGSPAHGASPTSSRGAPRLPGYSSRLRNKGSQTGRGCCRRSPTRLLPPVTAPAPRAARHTVRHPHKSLCLLVRLRPGAFFLDGTGKRCSGMVVLGQVRGFSESPPGVDPRELAWEGFLGTLWEESLQMSSWKWSWECS